MPRRALTPFVLVAAALLSACGGGEFPEGTPLNPIRVFFVTSAEVDAVRDSSDQIVAALEKETGLEMEAVVSGAYLTVIEGMSTADCDVAFMPTAAYIKANEKYRAEVALVTVRFGERYYRAQFIARADKNIRKLEDLEGKVWGFSDHNSTSGYIVPRQMLKNRGIRVKEELTTGTHPNTVAQVYTGKIDFGTTYWSPEGRDARARQVTAYPDVFEKVKIVRLTDQIPNDTVTFRYQFDRGMKQQITDALVKLSKEDPKVQKALNDMYNIDGLERVEPSFYDDFRKIMKGEVVESKDDTDPNAIQSTKGTGDDPYVVAAPADAKPLFPHDAIHSARVELAAPTAQLTAKQDGDHPRADLAVLGLAQACAAIDAKCTVVGVGDDQPQLALYGQPDKLPRGLASLGDEGVVAVYRTGDGLDEALIKAYARHLGLDPGALKAVDGAPPADAAVLVAPLGEAPDGWIVYQVSPQCPRHVAIASYRLPAPAFKQLYALVVGREGVYPGVKTFTKADKQALEPWATWLQAPKKDDAKEESE